MIGTKSRKYKNKHCFSRIEEINQIWTE